MRPRAHVLVHQCRDTLKVAVRACTSAEEALGVLAERGFANTVTELAVTNAEVLADLHASTKPKAAVINDPEILHYGQLAGARAEVMNQLLNAVASPEARRFWPISGVWGAYADSLVAYLKGVSHKHPPLRTQTGYAKYFVPYIEYMRATSPSERAEAKIRIKASFEARNRDRRLIDWTGIDGDGKQPVKWDFRAYCLEQGA